jgi:hypothetical protein
METQTQQTTRSRPGKTERDDDSSDRRDDDRETRQGTPQ